MAEIQMHSINRSLFGRTGLIVCVAYADGGCLKAEAHLVIRDESQTYLSKAMRFSRTDAIETPIPIDLDFMAQLAFNEATVILEAYVSQFPDGSVKSIQWKGATSTPADAKTLLNSWVRGEFRKIAEIEAKTESAELRKFLSSITCFSEIKRREL